MPDRLRELHAALGNDPFLVGECLARPALVDRLVRNFFAFDERFHGRQRAAAEALRQLLVSKALAATTGDPRRREVEIVRVEGGRQPEEPPARRRV